MALLLSYYVKLLSWPPKERLPRKESLNSARVYGVTYEKLKGALGNTLKAQSQGSFLAQLLQATFLNLQNGKNRSHQLALG